MKRESALSVLMVSLQWSLSGCNASKVFVSMAVKQAINISDLSVLK